MPSWYLFGRQNQAYRDEVFPPSVTVRVSIEAASTFGWERWIGCSGRALGIDRFGASAPAEILYEKFGLTADALVDTAKELLAG
jgi:transketolase